MPRRVRVATATNWRAPGSGDAIGGRSVADNVERALDVLNLAAGEKPDICCLPEIFNAAGVAYGRASEVAEPLDGPTVRALGAFAKEHRTWVVCPIHEHGDGLVSNTAVLLDRSGEVAGIYRKQHPTQGEMARGVVPGQGPIPVFDTDFGRIAVQICFDINWPEGWREARAGGAEVVFWPSAYEGGWPLRTLAFDNQIYVVASTSTPTSWIVDITGDVLATTGLRHDWTVATLDLEKRLFHVNFNDEKVEAIVRQYGDRLRWGWYDAEGYFTLSSVDDTLGVDDVIDAYQLETMDAYLARMTGLQKQAARSAEAKTPVLAP
jgi:beta-ureidopropionase